MSLLDYLEKSVKPILTRYYVFRSKLIGVKLHNIKQSDEEFHTHPWWGISFHWTPYYEERLINKPPLYSTIRYKRYFNIISPWTPHRVITDKPMWTLFIHFWRVNENWQYGETVAPWRGPDVGTNTEATV